MAVFVRLKQGLLSSSWWHPQEACFLLNSDEEVTFPCFTFVQKQYGNQGLKAFSPYAACRALIIIVAGDKYRPGHQWGGMHMPCLCTIFKFLLLPALFKFFLGGREDLNIALKTNLHRPGLGMRTSASKGDSYSVTQPSSPLKPC